MNCVQLVGRLTRDPEVRYSDNGTTIARFTLAVDRRFQQEGKESADFISCIAFKKTAEFVEKYFGKGNRIGVCGRIQTGSYTNRENQKVYTTDVVVEGVEFVESKSAKPEPGQPDRNQTETGWSTASADGFLEVGGGIGEEEIPF